MSKYQQATRLQGVHYDVRGRNMVEAQRMVAEGQRVLHLNIGNPGRFGFAAPEHLRRAVAEHVGDSEAYCPQQGLLSAREAIAASGLDIWVQVDGGVSVETIERAADAGADVFVAGSAVYGADDAAASIEQLRELARRGC